MSAAPEGDDPPPAAPDGRRRRRVPRALLLLLPALLVLVAAVSSARVYLRTQNDPAFCAGACHAPKEAAGPGDAWHLAKHAEVACQGCHAISPLTGLKLWRTTPGSKNVAPHGHATAKDCTSCHARETAKWAVVLATQGHREHRSAKDVTCLSCHKTTHNGGVNPEPEKACLDCHKNERLHKSTTAADAETCLSCHSYAASTRNVRSSTTASCVRCHGDAAQLTTSAGQGSVSTPLKPIDKHVLHGGVACQLCHNAHGKKVKAPDGQPVCVKCHQFELFQAGSVEKKASPEGHRNCEGCHKPHAPLKTAIQSCVNCHEKNATGLLAKMGPGAALAAPSVKTSALKHESCASCHLPHSWRAERSGCMQCHEDKAKLILTRSPAAHNACTNCHQVHGPPPNGSVCVTCHAKTKGNHVALAPGLHKNCTSCHNPHAPSPQETRNACLKCHATQVTQVLRDGPDGHKGCFGCHQPHNNPRPSADICAKCHADRAKVVAAASPPKHRACLSCHETHKFKISNPATACAKCHGPMFDAASAAQGKIPHQGDCKGCHQLHGSPGIAKASCLKCHEKVAAEFNPPNEKHGVCRSCHQPHKPVSTAVAACATCHDAKAAVATKWPPSSAHAKACTTCHQQHDVRVKKACANCHAQEASSAMGGKHQCAGCHQPHKEPPGTGPAWWSRCNECHAAKVQSVKQRGPKHSDCKNCHQPHRFAVPSCTSCHSGGLKGLHSVPQHAAKCAGCHDPHVKSVPAPAQCLACHTNRRGHEPDTKACQACHTFL